MKRRHEFYLEEEVSERLTTMATKPCSSKTEIMTDALKAYFDQHADTELDERFRPQLDRRSSSSAASSVTSRSCREVGSSRPISTPGRYFVVRPRSSSAVEGPRASLQGLHRAGQSPRLQRLRSHRRCPLVDKRFRDKAMSEHFGHPGPPLRALLWAAMCGTSSTHLIVAHAGHWSVNR